MTSLYLATVQEKFRQAAPSMQFVQNSLDAIEIWLSGTNTIPAELEQNIVREMADIFGEDMSFTVKGRLHGAGDKGAGPSGLIINNLQLPRTCQSDYSTD